MAARENIDSMWNGREDRVAGIVFGKCIITTNGIIYIRYIREQVVSVACLPGLGCVCVCMCVCYRRKGCNI